MEKEIEVTKTTRKPIVTYLYDAQGNWIGMEEKFTVSLEEAIKMGYKPLATNSNK